MLFNSYSFIFLFLPIVVSLYWLIPSDRLKKYWLVVASYVFYGAWSSNFALLMLGTTSVDYFTAQLIEDSKSPRLRKLWLMVSMVVNLGVLVVFKYYNFFADSINKVTPEPIAPIISVVLPIGISFYTFESMSYTIDVYRKRIQPLRHFVDYAHFITMFPRLVAGPIVRYSDLMDQVANLPSRLTSARALEGIHFFAIGLAKKLLIADPVASRLVDPLFEHAQALDFVSAWVAALGYTVQLYMDFSGYSDMAVGVALLIGFRLPRNFHLPYTARNISDFWKRWHISLSTWLRDYLYIPLGGNRNGTIRTAINLFLTMLLGGLWHGANWTFLAWGAYHGVAVSLYNTVLKKGPRLPHAIGVAGTFVTVVVGWVLFRATTIGEAWHVLRAMSGLNGFAFPHNLAWVWVTVLVGGLVISFTVDTHEFRPSVRIRWAVVYGLLATVLIARLASPSPFLYFQF